MYQVVKLDNHSQTWEYDRVFCTLREAYKVTFSKARRDKTARPMLSYAVMDAVTGELIISYDDIIERSKVRNDPNVSIRTINCLCRRFGRDVTWREIFTLVDNGLILSKVRNMDTKSTQEVLTRLQEKFPNS